MATIARILILLYMYGYGIRIEVLFSGFSTLGAVCPALKVLRSHQNCPSDIGKHHFQHFLNLMTVMFITFVHQQSCCSSETTHTFVVLTVT